MNQKKCPKCGENNPPEAVMCWACYTPLNAGAGAASLGGVAATGVGGTATAAQGIGAVTADEEKAKPKVTPVQIGVIAVGLLFAIGFGAKQMMGGGEAVVPVDEGAPPTAPVPNPGGGAAPAPAVAPGVAPASPGGSSAPSVELGFSVLLVPNPSEKQGVMAISTSQPNTTPEQAVGMAKEALGQFTNTNRWDVLHIYVFNNQQAAQNFKQYQGSRRNQGLGGSDYASLASAWTGAIVRVELRKGRQKVLYPSRNPSGWWRG